MMATLFDKLMQKGPTSEAATLGAIQAVKQAPGAPTGAVETAVAQQTGKEQLQAGAQQAAREETAGQLQLGEMSMESQKAEAARNIALDRITAKNEERLASLGHEASAQIAKESREFKVDSANRKYMNQQMLDQYAAEELLSQESLSNYVQQKEQVLQRRAQLMNTYAQRMQTILNQGYLREGQELDQRSREVIANIAADFKRKETEALKKRNKQSLINTVIIGAATVGGAVAGSATGTPWGAAAGAAAGQTIATVATSQ
jgi:hypothetical protein